MKKKKWNLRKLAKEQHERKNIWRQIFEEYLKIGKKYPEDNLRK